MIRIEFTQPEIYGILYRMMVARVKLSCLKLEQRILDSFGGEEEYEREFEKAVDKKTPEP